MKEEIKKKWVTALRSGEYKQTRHALKTRHGDCCVLGVLCDIYAKEKGVEWKNAGTSGIMIIDGTSADLPPKVVEWAGLFSTSPHIQMDVAVGNKVNKERISYPLMGLNDIHGKKFPELADIIEEQL